MKKTGLLFSIFCLFLFTNCQQRTAENSGSIQTNLSRHTSTPYTILVSLDGYRWDYNARFQPPNLTKFANNGVKAKSLIPCFPSKTFPNHYSIATGMYPENHDLVNNSFYDATKKEVYEIRNRPLIEDGSWYKGTPIWLQAMNAGMVTASFFFVGSEADIQGQRPTYFYRYDKSIANGKRVQQALDWLKMPEEKRPHLITMYFSDMDDTGHLYGPNNDEALQETLTDLDQHLGRLFDGVAALDIPVNIIVVSDHGMAEVPVNQLIPIESIKNENQFQTVTVGSVIHLYLKEGGDETTVFDNLKAKEKNYAVYKTEESPFYQKNPTNPRLGDFLIIPDYGFYFKTLMQINLLKRGGKEVMGHHGYDPKIADLQGIFYANGPAFKEQIVIESFENIHIYPMICKIMGLEVPEEVDGRIEVLENILK
jgi:predicted AlkP superfamily pyrophosphatase or phosphodiesterase